MLKSLSSQELICFPHFCLLVKLLPLVLQSELPVDDDVDLLGPGTDGQPDLLQPGTEGELTAGEPGGHRSHGDLLRLVPAGIFTLNSCRIRKISVDRVLIMFVDCYFPSVLSADLLRS